MLDEQQLSLLCCGRIIKATFINSSGNDVAGPHYAILLDTDEDIKNSDEYYVVVISTKSKTEFVVPVPGYTGLEGEIQCDWNEVAHRRAITEVLPCVIKKPEMNAILKMMRAFAAYKASQKSTKS